MTSSRRHHDSDSDDTGRRRGHRTKRKITDEEMTDYVAKKIAKRMKAQTVSGYSNNSNPFGDSNLNERFVWKKKIEKEVRQGASLDQFSVKAEKRRHKERMADMEKVKESRKERDVRKAQREEEMAVLARERARAEFQDWEKKEDEFMLEQSKLRSEIRLREGRMKPIDLLAKQQIDPVSVFKSGLSVKEMEELHNDIKTMQMGAAANPAPTYWEALVVVSEWELAEARKRDAFVEKEEERGLHSSIVAEVECFLKGQTFAQLQALQSEIDSQLRSGTAKVVEFWEGVANRLHIYKAKACLKEIHAKTCLESTTNDNEKVSDQDVEGSALVLSPMPALEEEPEGSYSPQLLHDDDDDVVNKEYAIHPEEDKAILERKRNAVLEEEQRRIQELSSKTMGPMADGDVVFGSNDEISLGSSQVYWWHDKYRPRKPKYFNRVHTGYEWNKYNQTHYDHDNPPPKTVHGYKFNIFYPDLVDKSKAPSYSIEKDGDSTETCIVRFHAGPPYEDVAFRIVNKEWEYSRKKGFKCTFERGILQLYFNFERYRYRR